MATTQHDSLSEPSNYLDELSDTVLREMYRTMQVIRQCEERLAKSHQQGLVHGACHTYVGQEAIATGLFQHLRNEDVAFSTHRGHGHALAKGMSPKELISELYGRQAGCGRGRGGSMHLFQPEIGMMGTSGIVGPCILQACGGGYTFKIQKTDNVSVACFGDGAVNNGAFHEGLNMAAIWDLPVIFVCENNQFATEVPFSYSSGIPDIGRRGENYGMPGFEVDGNDVFRIHSIAKDAVERARSGKGPTLIECKTYRTRAHAEGMGDFTYRTKQDVEDWKKLCPILRFETLVSSAGRMSDDEFQLIQNDVATLIEESHRSAEDSSFPEAASATHFVYSVNEPVAIIEPDLENCETKEITFVAATHEALDSAMEKDPNIFVMGEGIGSRGGNFTTTIGLYDKYGADRLCDTPICERGFVGLGCGAAMTGTRPVIDFMFIDFINDSFGEMINQIAKIQYMSNGRIKMPILLRGCGGIGHSAATHHSGIYHSIYAHIPGLRVVVPSNAYDAKGLFAHALKSTDPVLMLEHRELMSVKSLVPTKDYEIPFGKAKIVRRGKDATVVAISLMVEHAKSAAEGLAAQGIEIEIIDPRTVSPLDIDTILNSVANTGRLLVVDEAFAPCSVASEVAAQIADRGFDELDAPIKRLHGAFTPTPYSPTLEAAIVPQVDDVIQAVHELIAE